MGTAESEARELLEKRASCRAEALRYTLRGRLPAKLARRMPACQAGGTSAVVRALSEVIARGP